MVRTHALPLRPWLAVSSLIPPLLFWLAVALTCGRALSDMLEHSGQGTLLGLLVLVLFPLSAVAVGLYGELRVRDAMSRPMVLAGASLVLLAFAAVTLWSF